MLQCYNRGCDQTFDPKENHAEACCHHPGHPYFHDAYKGWSCCKKKSIDFDEFLGFKGCTMGPHSNIPPVVPEKPKKLVEDVTPVMEPIKPPKARPPIDAPMVKVAATVAPALKAAIDGFRPAATTAANDVGTREVPVGTSCKNTGCMCSYTGPESDAQECWHHPGVPIFHEGLKYWLCCQKKTTDFSEFMSQKGCTCGKHKWFKEVGNTKVAKCRYDWHQTPTDVIVAIYAKMYDYKESFVEVNSIRLHANLVFPGQDDAHFDLDIELRGVVDVEKTTAHMYGTKLEITMPKKEPGSWSKLEFPQAVRPPPVAPSTAKSEPKTVSSDSEDDLNLDEVKADNSYQLSKACMGEGLTLKEVDS